MNALCTCNESLTSGLRGPLEDADFSDDGKKLLETYERDFKKTFEQSGHGFKPVDVPFGIRITQEVAERGKPWLLADQPWEKSVASPTVLFDEGRFRCWYSHAAHRRKAEDNRGPGARGGSQRQRATWP